MTEILTVTISESTEQYATQADPFDQHSELTWHDVTPATITDANGDRVDTISGPASEDWLPEQWDAALTDAGYRRVSEWDTTNYTAAVTEIAR